jgi:hypothetical protein
VPQITKNQHFVPQSLIKHFSSDNSGVIHIYDSMRDILRPPTTVNRALSENFFYDKDNSIENFLAKNVEAPAAVIFEKIICDPKKYTTCNRIDLLRFITVQLNRTPRALFASLENIENFTDSLIQQLGELNGFDPEVTKNIKIIPNDPKSILGMQTVEGALNWPLIDDLGWHLLINKTKIDYVISDHPVAHYNWYLRDSENPKYTSLTSCGLQIFLPISHSITFCLYDKKIYKIGEKNDIFTHIHNESDVLLLNELQFRSRESFIVFSTENQSDYVKSWCKKIPANSMHQNNSWTSPPIPSENDELKSTHVTWRTQANFTNWLSCSKIKRRVTKREVECHDRNPDIVMAHRLFIEKARSKRKPI